MERRRQAHRARHRRALAFCVWLTLALAPPMAGAVVIVSGPQGCKAVRPADAPGIEWRETGLLNLGEGAPTTEVVCPVFRNLREGRFATTLDLRNLGDAPSMIECVAVETMATGSVVREETCELALEPSARGACALRFDLQSADHVTSLRCRLPAGTGIITLRHELQEL